jgi:hypothetical protein
VNQQEIDRFRRYHDLVKRFVALDPDEPSFATEYDLLKHSARTTLASSNLGKRSRLENLKIGREVRIARRKREQELSDQRFLPHIKQIMAEGKTKLRQIAAELNARGIRPHHASKWSHGVVRQILVRAGLYP